MHHPDIAGLRIAIENGDYTGMTQTVGNALESVTIARHPIVQQIKDRMLKYGADAALMSGSGPTVFALCEKHEHNGFIMDLKAFVKKFIWFGH